MENITAWNPDEDQWWITGFNPQMDYNSVDKQVMIGSIDFSGHEEMYETFKSKYDEREAVKDYALLDNNTKMVWVCWYERSII